MSTVGQIWRHVKAHGLRKTISEAESRLAMSVGARLILHARRIEDADPVDDPFHRNFRTFIEAANKVETPNILEVGARNDNSDGLRHHFPSCKEYVGFDVYKGRHVDVVGDAHALSKCLPTKHFDFVFSISVFEHLAMPWHVILEMNKVLKPGGTLFISTHPTWPAHELPWDFWRFNKEAFKVLLNARTGFEIVTCDEGLSCSVVPHGTEGPMLGLAWQPAYLGVSVIARKIGAPDPNLNWDLEIDTTLKTQYPMQGLPT